jgi:hypothetical protein
VGAATDALTVPLENPDIQLSATPDASAAATARKRRQTFGTGTSGTGVNI